MRATLQAHAAFCMQSVSARVLDWDRKFARARQTETDWGEKNKRKSNHLCIKLVCSTAHGLLHIHAESLQMQAHNIWYRGRILICDCVDMNMCVWSVLNIMPK